MARDFTKWDSYFIKVAETVSEMSKDRSTKVGCVITAPDNTIISTGFNGFPPGIDERYMVHERPMKYELVCHAEMNAIVFARKDIHGCTLYCTHAPCPNCLKHCITAGISRVLYKDGGPMVDRGTLEQKEALLRLLFGSTTYCVNWGDRPGLTYIDEIRNSLKEQDRIDINERIFTMG